MNITPQDVGRKVVHRDGKISEIVDHDGSALPVLTGGAYDFWYNPDGTWRRKSDSHVIAFLDEFDSTDWEQLTDEGKRRISKPGVKTMRHVIADEMQEDTIEWRLVMDDSIPTLEARKAGEECWREVAWVVGSEFAADRAELEFLGFTEFDFD